MITTDNAAMLLGMGAIIVTLGIGTCSTNSRIDDGFTSVNLRIDDTHQRIIEGFGPDHHGRHDAERDRPAVGHRRGRARGQTPRGAPPGPGDTTTDDATTPGNANPGAAGPDGTATAPSAPRARARTVDGATADHDPCRNKHRSPVGQHDRERNRANRGRRDRDDRQRRQRRRPHRRARRQPQLGSVIAVERAGRMSGSDRISIRFHTLAYDGIEIPLETSPLTRSGPRQTSQNATRIDGGPPSEESLARPSAGAKGRPSAAQSVPAGAPPRPRPRKSKAERR